LGTNNWVEIHKTFLRRIHKIFIALGLKILIIF
jgi:hypothetical protein